MFPSFLLLNRKPCFENKVNVIKVEMLVLTGFSFNKRSIIPYVICAQKV